MYLGAPAWLGLMTLGLLRQMPIRADLGALLFILTMVMNFAPKLATLADVLARSPLRQAYRARRESSSAPSSKCSSQC